ncbi:expressed hypothetical protein [Trichoplax adhaerens]|uniref:thiopurine S-methyltransferase n=1 Tax=Trichoplax adhaerens TaxID=10228 RepID=B3S8Z8_TRIAD|nr:expressed hypothetical protein [Trichoplax adhaerens]EDV20790.1 expressed hypothetical protein [Trichoplax adhaerens]|eukprot:XP_002116731.1 expressed hypothetical protein [Trichoplax adhaerens]
MTVEEFQEQEEFTADGWRDIWEKGQLDQSAEKVQAQLVQFHSLLLAPQRTNRIFVPMCGKAKDLLWLAGKGATVVGTEFAAYACESFFKDNNVPFDVVDLDGVNGKAYFSTDDKLNITIYQCDHYLLTSSMVGFTFDGVWDRGSFNSVPTKDRNKYVNHMKTLLTSTATMLVVVVEYEIISQSDERHNIPSAEECLLSAFAPSANIEKIDRSITEWQGVYRATKATILNPLRLELVLRGTPE